MSLFKLAAYGALGYLVYQTFTMNRPTLGKSSGPRRDLGNRSGWPSGRAPRGASGGTQMTGGGEGTTETTQEASGMSEKHRVGRGVTSA